MMNDSLSSLIHSRISYPHGITLTWNYTQPHLHGNEAAQAGSTPREFIPVLCQG